MSKPIHIISLGAGVQSSTMALMAANGEIGPMPTAAIFADTQDEPQSVYKWLDWLEKQLPFPVLRVTKGSLSEASLVVRVSKKSGQKYIKHAVPAYIVDKEGRKGIMMRQCTLDFKILVIHRKIREMRKANGNCEVVQWIGISHDEHWRIKPSRVAKVKNVWPLVEREITRRQCIDWMRSNNFPVPPRSSCVYCPYHSNQEWMRLKTQEPAEFEKACQYDEQLRITLKDVIRGRAFLHNSRVPLREADFRSTDDRRGQGSLFNNECEGMCGV